MTLPTRLEHPTLARALLGVYLLVHFAQLMPYATELFSSEGMLPAVDSPFHGLPSPLLLCSAPLVVDAFIYVGAACALSLMLGGCVRASAFALWVIWAALFVRNPLIANPSIPFVGLLLLAHALLPEARSADAGACYRLQTLYGLMFVVLALGYSYSGATKLMSPSWLDGSALRHVLENPLARPSALRSWLLATPGGVLRWGTYAVLALELMFAPLCLSSRLRPWLWTAMVAMHLAILVLVDFADLTLGMLLVHAYTFDPRWLERARRARALVLGAAQAKP